MNGRSLRATINQTEIGTLQEVAGLWSFQYAADWLDCHERRKLRGLGSRAPAQPCTRNWAGLHLLLSCSAIMPAWMRDAIFFRSSRRWPVKT